MTKKELAERYLKLRMSPNEMVSGRYIGASIRPDADHYSRVKWVIGDRVINAEGDFFITLPHPRPINIYVNAMFEINGYRRRERINYFLFNAFVTSPQTKAIIVAT